ncbi:TRAP transporter small permease [Consotaella aegiceratis]|uniref:TRAP transporter small permease n=1 Tax=Consotaella aegiceratis TaxID=3097961 RepID=UPI002F3F4697
MRTLRLVLDRLTAVFLCILLSVMIVLITWQVFSRYALNDPSVFTEELLRFGVIWISLVGAAYVTGKNKHMSVDLVKEMLGGSAKKILHIVIQLFFVAFAVAVLIVGGMHAISIASHQVTPVLQLPMGAVYAALPTSGVLMAIYALLNIGDALIGQGVPEPEVLPSSALDG